MVIIAAEAVPASSKPPSTVSVHISTGGRHGFGASAPLSTRASPVDFSGARDSAIVPELVKLVEPPSTLAEELSPFITRSAAEAPSVRLGVVLSSSTSSSVARRGCLVSCSRPSKS